MIWGKSLLPINLKSNTNKKGLDMNKVSKSKANTHLNGARRVRINLSENPRLTLLPKTKFNHDLGEKSITHKFEV